MIYRMTSSDYRKVFGITGNVPRVTNGFRMFTGRGQPTRGKPIVLRGATPALSGLVGQPERTYAQEIGKIKEKGKKGEVGRKGRTPPSNPSWTRIGGGLLLPPFGRPLGALLSLKARPSPSLLYILRY